MGEIADALKRARERGASPPPAAEADPRPVLGGLVDAGTGDLERVEAIPAISERTIPRLRVADPAIAVEEGPRVEACRGIALRVRAQLETARSRCVAVVSAGRADGKTTVSCNLALALASLSQGRQVALVDLDLRKPSVAAALGLGASVGVEDVLQGKATAADVQVSIGEPELDVYPAFEPPPRSHELLVLPSLARLIQQLEERYEVVVIDTPPVLLTPDANLILKHVRACLPIARAGWTRQRSFRALVEALPRHAVLEGLLNGGRAPGHYSDDDYYSKARGPGDGAASIDWSTLRKRLSRRDG